MKLTVWTYEGPPHVGAMRVATGMKGLHYVLHAPQGDTYADLLFTMIERRDHRPPVTYTTFQARDLGSDTAELFKTACRDAYDRFQPQAMIVGASCTAELIQDDPGGLAESMGLPIPVIALELPSYQRKESFGAAETFFQLVRHLAKPCAPTAGLTCNLLGPTALGFRHRDDVAEVTKLLASLGIGVNVTAPLGATPADLARLPAAEFNVMLYPETAEPAARWLEKTHGQHYTRTVPIGVGATRDFVAEVGAILGRDLHGRRERPAPALVDPLGRQHLPHRQARLRLRRRHPRPRHGPRRPRRDGLRGRRPRRLQPRVRPAPARGRPRLRPRGAGHRRLPRGRGRHRGRASRADPRHPDGAPHRQAPRHPLRRDLRARPRPGLPRPLLAGDGLRGRQRALRHPDPSRW